MKKSSAQGIAARIRDIRRREGLTQSVFAERLSVPQKKISDIERCRTAPNPELLVALREEFGVTIDWILAGKEPKRVAEVEHAVQFDQGKISSVLSDLKEILEKDSIQKILLSKVPCPEDQRARRIPFYELNETSTVKYDENGLPAKDAPETLFVPPIVEDPDAFALRLQTDRMKPEFSTGDILIFSPSRQVENGDYVCAHFDNQTVFRQYFVDGSTSRLVAANRNVPEIKIPADKPVRIFRLGFAVSRY